MQIKLSKPYFRAGQYVTGVVNIYAQKQLNSNQILIKIEGVQNVRYITYTKHQKSKKSKQPLTSKTFTNQSVLCSDQFVIAKLKNDCLQKGCHSFKFEFLLPQSLPGSIYIYGSCTIRYKLTAMIKGQHLKANKDLKVIEPPRLYLGMTESNTSFVPKCLGCCKNLGNVNLKLMCNKNVIKPRDQIHLFGQIDNRNGDLQLRFVNVNFRHIYFMMINQNESKETLQNTINVRSFKNIQKGELFKFDFAILVPKQYHQPSVIGSICARYYYLQLIAQCGDPCPQNLRVKLYLFLNSEQVQQYVEGSQMQRPNIWNPVVHEAKVINNSLQGFVYKYNQKMPFYNQNNGFKNAQNLLKMNEPYFKNKVSENQQCKSMKLKSQSENKQITQEHESQDQELQGKFNQNEQQKSYYDIILRSNRPQMHAYFQNLGQLLKASFGINLQIRLNLQQTNKKLNKLNNLLISLISRMLNIVIVILVINQNKGSCNY